jgi:hypothetical protein
MGRRRTLWMYTLAFAFWACPQMGCKSAPMRSVSAPSQNASPEEPLPFARKELGGPGKPPLPRVLTVPAGTAVSIRLKEALSSETARPGQNFQGMLDEPLSSDGFTYVPRGASVTGRVLAVRRSGALHSGGVLQLALESLEAGDQKVALQTSTVIAGSGAKSAASRGAGAPLAVEAERRLTFRLRQPAFIAANPEQRSIPVSR